MRRSHLASPPQHSKAILLGLCALNRANIPMDAIKLVARKLKPHYRRSSVRRVHHTFKVGWIYDIERFGFGSVEAKVQILARTVSKSGKITIEYRISNGISFPLTARATVKTRKGDDDWEGDESMQVRDAYSRRLRVCSLNASGVELQTKEEFAKHHAYVPYHGD